jgi:hypothetical protein
MERDFTKGCFVGLGIYFIASSHDPGWAEWFRLLNFCAGTIMLTAAIADSAEKFLQEFGL